MSNLLKEALQPERLMINDNGLLAAIGQEQEEPKVDLSFDGVIRSIIASGDYSNWKDEDLVKLKEAYPGLPGIVLGFISDVGTASFHVKGIDEQVYLFCPNTIKEVMGAQEQLGQLLGVELVGSSALYITNGLFIDLCGAYVGKHAIFAIDTKTGPYVVFEDFMAMLNWFMNAKDEVVDYTSESESEEGTQEALEEPQAEEGTEPTTEDNESTTESSEAPEGDATDSVDASEAQGTTKQSLIQQMLINKYTWKDIQAEYDTLADFLNALLQDTSLSQESCVGCGATTTVSTTVKNISDGTRVVEQGGNKDGVEYKEGENNGLKFSYNKGENTKEIVQLTGPLSEIYTRALNIYYRKRPAFDEHTVPEDITQDEREQLLLSSLLTPERDENGKVVTSQASAESAVQDNEFIQAIVQDVTDETLPEDVADDYIFVNDTTEFQDPSEINATVHIHTVTDALKPEVVDIVNTDAEKNKNVVLVVTDTGVFNTTAPIDTGTKLKIIDTEEKETYNPSIDTPDLEGALESLYAKNGITYVKEFSGFIKYLAKQHGKWRSKHR